MKTWNKPELIAIVRTKPEETILGVCKSESFNATSNQWHSTCNGGSPACMVWCLAKADS